MKKFSGTVEIISYYNGKLELQISENEKQFFDAFYNYNKNTKILEFIVKHPFRQRTTGYRSQNHRINSHIMQIANYTGYTFDEMKYWIKQQAMSAGYPAKYDLHGNLMPISETDASIEDAMVLIETINRIAAELNIKLKEYDDKESLKGE